MKLIILVFTLVIDHSLANYPAKPFTIRHARPKGGFKGLDNNRVGCPRDWISSPYQCFQFQWEARSFRKAHRHCPTLHPKATLAAIRSKDDNDALNRGFRSSISFKDPSINSSYIGIKMGSDIASTVWYGTNTSIVIFTNFLRTPPEGNCVVIDSQGTWKDGGSCDDVRPFWCSLDKFECALGTAPSWGSCFWFNNTFDGMKDPNRLVDFCTAHVNKSELAYSMGNGMQQYLGPYTHYMMNGLLITGIGTYLGPFMQYDPFNYVQNQIENTSSMKFVQMNTSKVPSLNEMIPELVSSPYPLNIFCESKRETVHVNCDTGGGASWTEDIESGHCYLNVEKNYTWRDAERHCRGIDKHADLASISDPRSQLFVETMWRGNILNNEFPHFWIGMRRIDGKYIWSDRSSVSYYNFGEEEDKQNDSCAHFDLYAHYGKWILGNCTVKRPFMCMKRANYFTVHKSAIRQHLIEESSVFFDDCPSEWLKFKKECFIFPTVKTKYSSALEVCKDLDADANVPIINYPSIWTFVSKRINAKTWYIAGNDLPMDECNAILLSREVESVPCDTNLNVICSRPQAHCFHDSFGGYCYRVSSMAKNCSEAMKSCQTELQHGSLASVHSVFANEYISTMSKAFVPSRLMIGLYQNLTWHDGSLMNFNNFHKDSSDSSSSCKSIQYGGNWAQVMDNEELNYICSSKSNLASICHPGWVQFKKKCFLFVEKKMSLRLAQKNCYRMGAKLSTFTLTAELEFIQRHLVHQFEGNYSTLWTEIKSSNEHPTFFESKDFIKGGRFRWGTGEPRVFENESCVLIDAEKEFRMSTSGCNDRHASICERTGFIERTQRSMVCNKKQIHIGQFCYELFSEKKTFNEAKEYCTLMDGQLLTIPTKMIQYEIETFFEAYPYPIWMGIQYYNKSFIWNGNIPLKSFENWAQDVEKSNETCYILSSSGIWNSSSCSRKHAHVCQYFSHSSSRFDGDFPQSIFPAVCRGIRDKSLCYNFVSSLITDSRANFTNAREHCRLNFQGDLAVFNSIHSERSALRELDVGNEEIFIGLKEDSILREYQWVDPRVPYGAYTNWGPHSGHNSSRGPCVCIHREIWKNCLCSDKKAFICMGIATREYDPILKYILVLAIFFLALVIGLYQYGLLLRDLKIL